MLQDVAQDVERLGDVGAVLHHQLLHGQAARGDRHVYATRTRFIPDRLLALFERTVWPLAVAGVAPRVASQGPRIDVGARMRGMWR